MDKLRVDLEKDSYDIIIDKDIIVDLDKYIDKEFDKVLILTDENVNSIYEKKININENCEKLVLPPGENSKSMEKVEKVLSFMLSKNFTRNSAVIAFGGGVIGDLGGFCASIYMRGITYIQIPTTLISQVDSSVGGKTGINYQQTKNIIGSFYQPKKVIIDVSFLDTLKEKDIISGIGEIIKYGIIYDYDFFKYIKDNIEKIKNLDKEIMPFIIKRSCEIKSAIVSQDEKEKGLRKVLNLGHTIGHAIEGITDFKKYAHGEGVILGIYYETKVARNLNLISEDYSQEILEFLTGFNIDFDLSNYKKEELIYWMKRDKKNKNNNISFVLPIEKGKVQEILLKIEEIPWNILL